MRLLFLPVQTTLCRVSGCFQPYSGKRQDLPLASPYRPCAGFIASGGVLYERRGVCVFRFLTNPGFQVAKLATRFPPNHAVFTIILAVFLVNANFAFTSSPVCWFMLRDICFKWQTLPLDFRSPPCAFPCFASYACFRRAVNAARSACVNLPQHKFSSHQAHPCHK